MLRAAKGDAPSAASRGRAAAALGLAAGVGAAGTTATTAAAAGSSKLLASAGGVILLKWAAIGAAGTIVALGALKYSADLSPSRAGDTRAATSAVHSVNGTTAPLPVPGAPVLVPMASASAPAFAAPAESAANANASSNANTHRAVSPPPASSSSLTEELRELERVRAYLAAGDAHAALATLDAHDRTFKGGDLAPEAAVLRIEALAQSGDDDAVASRAKAFLSSFPDSPQERRVQSILDAISAKRTK
jgi:hypothetical protein